MTEEQGTGILIICDSARFAVDPASAMNSFALPTVKMKKWICSLVGMEFM